MRCDLHVHSRHSGAADVPVLGLLGRECYSDPLEIHERALARGMDLVTLTDHDTIDGALGLAHLPNTFVSEEVTIFVDGGRQLHVNVFGIDPRQHERIQSRRRDPEAFFEFLDGLRAGLCAPSGRSGDYARLTTEVARIFAAGYAETARELRAGRGSALRVAACAALLPLLPLVPLFTLGVHLHERRFGARLWRAFQSAHGWAPPSGRQAPARVPMREAA
jgi:hypothetical protein